MSPTIGSYLSIASAASTARTMSAEKGIEGQGKCLVEKATGEEFEVITEFFDPVDTAKSGAVAFCIRDGVLVPLRVVGWRHQADQSHQAGEIFGREAGPNEPMPISSGWEIS